MKSLMLLGCLAILVTGCMARPRHLSVPLQTGEATPVVLHKPAAWACSPAEPGRLVCTNITDEPQLATIGNKQYRLPGQTQIRIEESRHGVWL
jgi:hypothetical protein